MKPAKMMGVTSNPRLENGDKALKDLAKEIEKKINLNRQMLRFFREPGKM